MACRMAGAESRESRHDAFGTVPAVVLAGAAVGVWRGRRRQRGVKRRERLLIREEAPTRSWPTAWRGSQVGHPDKPD